MKNALIIFLIAFSSALQIMAQENGPKIVFEETVFVFDTIMHDGPGEHVFRFSNKGDAPLLITSAFSSCGCVIPEWPKEPIAPNSESCVKVKYNTNKIGRFTKVIIVKSNDSESPKTVLRINGVVVEPPKEQN